jgi:hypothetical protein
MLRAMRAWPRQTRASVRSLLARPGPGPVAVHPGYVRHLGRRRAVLVVTRARARTH